jgi:hypothetical protein
MRITAALLTLFGVAAPAFANWDEHCARNPIRGPIKTITEYEIRVDRQTRQPSGQPWKRYFTEISDDGRTVTRIEYSADSPYEILLQLYPTSVSEYDDQGKLLRFTLTMGGNSHYSVTRCTYDFAGRIATVTQQTLNYEQDTRDITYTYGPDWRRELWRSTKATVITTQVLDTQGRAVRESFERHIPEEHFRDSSHRSFEYTGQSTKTCISPDSGPPFCLESRKDHHDNVVSSQGPHQSSAVTYEYDAFGNWTSRLVVTVMNSGARPVEISELRRREFTYR